MEEINFVQDQSLLRELAKQYADLAAMEVNSQRKSRCQAVNGLSPQRPPVWIDEIPWHEMDIDGQLRLQCSDPLAREIEGYLRKSLFRWKYFQADMVLTPYYPMQKSSFSSGIGVTIREETQAVDAANGIVSHHYEDELDTEEKVERLHCPIITRDPDKDQLRKAKAEEYLGGILPVRLCGTYIYFSPWDQISMLRGVEPILMDMIDRPELIHLTMKKFQEIGLSTMEQMEQLDLLDYEAVTLHCTPPYTKDLPAPDYDGGKVRCKDIWFRSMAQMLSTVSPSMFEEFELEYMLPMAEKCGLTYYGCCEPLSDRIELLKRVPNLRKIGVSPWADIRKCAEQIGGSYVYARKPNPAMVAGTFDKPAVQKEIRETIQVCLEYQCPYEFVLKDISTVSYKPENLILWNQTVQETIDEFY